MILPRVVDLKKRKTVASIKNLGSGIISLDCQKRGQISKEYFATDIKMPIDCYSSTSRFEKKQQHILLILAHAFHCCSNLKVHSWSTELSSLVSKNFGRAYKMHDCQVNFLAKITQPYHLPTMRNF